MTSDAAILNREVWDRIYRRRAWMLYPSEMLVRVFFRHLRRHLARGARILDFGAGSGNHAEFLVRQGYEVVAADISAPALEIIEQRFAFNHLPAPRTLLVDPRQPLAGQLDEYDAVVAWDVLYYNTAAQARATIATLLEHIRPQGMALFNMITPRHHFVTDAECIAPQTYRFRGQGQQGAVMCAPHDAAEFRQWCAGMTVVASGGYGHHDETRRAEYIYLAGVRS